MPTTRHQKRANGFTLVEILIVVLILGVLAMLVMPSFVSASGGAKESVLRDHLRLMRIQIELYTAQHQGAAPGYPGGDRSATPTSAAFEQQMTWYTNENGAVSATASPSTPIRPYLDRVPANPFNNLASVLVVGDSESFPAADGATYGWFFKPATRQFIVNHPGSDVAGRAYTSY